MRGPDITQEPLFSICQTADFAPKAHPLRAIREILNRALRDMDLLFESMYEHRGRDSVPPEWLLRGLVLQALYGIRSERLLCEQLGYNMLYRWFVGLGMEDATWDHSTYTQNRDRLIEHEAVRALFNQVMQQAEAAQLLSDEHFSVDGILIRAWASHKSFVPKDGPPPSKRGPTSNPEIDFKRQKRSNDTAGFVAACREHNVTPHVARNVYQYTTKTGQRVDMEGATMHARPVIRAIA
jgi:transposase